MLFLPIRWFLQKNLIVMSCYDQKWTFANFVFLWLDFVVESTLFGGWREHFHVYVFLCKNVSRRLYCSYSQMWIKRFEFCRFCYLGLHFKHSLKKYSNSSNFLFCLRLTLCLLLLLTMLGVIFVMQKPAVASAGLLIGLPESKLYMCGLWSTIGNVFSGEMFVANFWNWVNCRGNGLLLVKIRPVRFSGTLFGEALCPITIWWVCVCRA